MGKANKWVGGGRTGGSKPGNSQVPGVPKSTTQPYQPTSRGPGSPNVRTQDTWAPGDEGGTRAISSHNNINDFLRGAKSRGPYGGPSFRSFNNMESNYMKPTPTSHFTTPSGSDSIGPSPRGLDAPRTVKVSADAYNDPMRTNPHGAKASTPGMNRGSISRGKGTGSGKLGSRRGR